MQQAYRQLAASSSERIHAEGVAEERVIERVVLHTHTYTNHAY
jgi:hypothetical protein